MIVLAILLFVQLSLLSLDDHVACQTEQMVVVHCIELPLFDVVVVYDVVSPSCVCLDQRSVHPQQFSDELAIGHSCEEVVRDSWIHIDWLLYFIIHFSLLRSPLRTGVHIEKRKILWLCYLVSSIDNDALVDVSEPVQLLDEDESAVHQNASVLSHQVQRD